MDVFTRTDLQTLQAITHGPFVSILIPTHRVMSEEDRIRWKNQVGEAEKLLKKGEHPPTQTRELLGEARRVTDDQQFWNHQSDGLAGFFSPGFSKLFRMPLPLPELTVVGSRFHVRPLLPALDRNNRYYLLALSENAVRLFQGNGHGVEAVDLEGVPKSLADALRFDEKLSHLQVHSQPPTGVGQGPGRGGQAMYHGQGVGEGEDEKTDRLRYFQQIDRGLRDYLNGENAPLVLAGVKEHWPLYREANSYAHLLDEGVPGSPDRENPRGLHEKAWPIVQASRPDERTQDLGRFGHHAGTEEGMTSTDLSEVVTAATQGRVAVLFLPERETFWGECDPEGGKVTRHDHRRGDSEDLLNVAATATLAGDGTVHEMPRDRLPGGGEVAAVYRWKA